MYIDEGGTRQGSRNFTDKRQNDRCFSMVKRVKYCSILFIFGKRCNFQYVHWQCAHQGKTGISLRNTDVFVVLNDIAFQGIMDSFNAPNSDPKILLLSLTAGGVGLNLVGGNHLLLIDIHWNPQLEVQAQDRIYRFGQKKDVFIYKLVILLSS